jgi:hypothetical protein
MLKRTGVRFGVVIQLGLLILAVNHSALSQTVTKLWSVDLSKDQDFQRRSQAQDANLRPPTLDFLTDDQIIVAFDDNAVSTPSPGMTPFGFHVLSVGASSGGLNRKLSFKVLLDTSQAEATGDGNFLVLAGEELKKFSSSLEEVASLATPLELHGQATEQRTGGRSYFNPRYETWQMDVAPGGRELVLAHTKNPHVMEVSWLRTSDFTTIATAEGEPSGQQGMSAGSQAVWLFPDGWAKLLSSSGQELTLCNRCLRGYFLTDDLVFLDERDKYEVKTVSGEKRASGKLKLEGFKFCRAANATRFAYATGHYEGSGFPLKTHFAARMLVRVFDWNAMKQADEISFDRPEQPKNSASSGFKETAIALSPDGHRLLVLNGSVLNLYRVK